MKIIIKKGKPYRIHKCSKCKTKYVYKYVYSGMGFIHCPECNNFIDSHYFDRKITAEKYNKFKSLEKNQ